MKKFLLHPSSTGGAFFALLFASVFISTILPAQSLKNNWNHEPFGQNDFIENKGQFDKMNGTDAAVLFGVTASGVHMYFSSKGLTYRYDERVQMTEEEKEEHKDQLSSPEGEEEETMYKVVPHFMHVEWIGANPNPEIITEEKVSYYYTYRPTGNEATTVANAYKKIIYKNLYPGIDVEYIIPKDKPGVKYSVILHPGADASLVKMKYVNEEKIFFDVHQNLIITSSYGNFTDHAPQTFYSGNKRELIFSEFVLNGDEISFHLQHYDRSKEIIIDPWVSSPTFATNNAYDVNFDLAGNVYAYGSINPLQLCKFNSSGVLQWIYNATGMYNFGCGFAPYGDFAVDEVSGSSYLSEGFNSSTGTHVFKVNTNGIQIGVSPGIAAFNELWRIEYNRCINKIIGAGGGTSGSYQGIVLDTSLATWTPVNVLSTAESLHDMALLSIDNGSNSCYMATAASLFYPTTFNNVLYKCAIPSLTPVYNFATGHNFQEVSSITYTTGTCANGFNGITNSPIWLYTYDGVTLKRWNKNTGAFVTSITLGGTPFSWGGLWADECDNIYVGYQNSIRVYNTSLTLVTTYPLTGTVFDVKVGINNKLYACGVGFVTSIDLPPTSLIITTTSTPSSCQQCNGTATVSTISTACGGGNFNYLWQPGNQTTQTATNLCAGVYTVTLTSNCNNTFTATVAVANTSSTPISATSSPQSICVGQSVTLSASGANTYTWSPSTALSATTGSSVTANPTSTTTYTVVGDVNGCTSSAQITVVVNPLPVLSVSPAPVICNGQSAILTASGAITYSWSPSTALSATTGASVTANPSSTTTYTVTGDQNGCTSTAQVIVTVNPVPVVTVSPAQIICNGQSATLTAGGASTYSWSPSTALSATTGSSVNANPSSTTTYTVTGNSNGCSATAQVTVTVNPLPVVIVTPPPAICVGQQTATLAANGAQTYSWTPSSSLSSSTGSSVTANPASTTTYTVTGTDNNGCTATTQVTVTVNPLPAISVTQPPAICLGQQTATLTANGAQTYTWTPSSSLSSSTGSSVTANPASTTTYTVTATDVNGCTVSTQATVTVNVPPVVTVTPAQTICNGQSTTLTANGASTYSWSPSAALSATTGSSVNANPSSTITYTVTGSSNGCTATAQVTITVNPLPVLSVSPAQTICNGQSATLTVNGANTYAWSPSTALSATTGSSVSANPSSTITYTVTGDLNGCTSTAQTTITVNPLPVTSVSPAQTICNGQSTTLTANGANTYSWSPATALSATTGSSVSANPSATTTYTVTGNSSGCTSAAQVTVTVNPLPVVSVTPAQTICNGQSAALNAGGANTYAWSPSTALSATTGSSVTANPSSTTMYTVTGDLNGCTATAQTTVTVNPLPVLSVSPPQTICNGQPVNLSASGANTYTWSPSTSLSATTGANVTASPSSSITYTVTGDLNGCTSTAQIPVTVSVLPVMSVTPNQTICDGQSTTLTAGGANTYTWSPSTALSSSTSASVTANPSSTITYTVTGDIGGCTSSIQVTVNVNPLPVLSVSPSQTICDGQSATLNASGANTYAWSPSTALSSSTGASVTANPSSTTTYIVTGDLNGCTATAQVTVTVNPLPVLTISPSTTICDGQSTILTVNGANTYAWSPSTALSSSTGSSVTANPSSTITYTVTGDLSGCTATAQVTVTVNPVPVLTISPSATICDGQSTTLSVSGANTYAWSPSTALSSTTAASVISNPSSTTTYNVTGDLNGCTATAQVTVTVNPLPVLSVSPTQNICSGQSATLNVSGANTYTWSPSTALSSTTGSNIVANPVSATTYTVTGDLNGCTSTAQVTVNVNQLPVINFSPTTISGCSPVSVPFFDLSSVAAPSTITSWSWNFGDYGSGNFNTSTLQNPSHTYISPGSYTVRLTVTTNNGCTQTDSIVNLVTVHPNPVASFHATPTVTTLSEAVIQFINTSQNYDFLQWDFGDNHTSILINPNHTYTDTGRFSVMLITTTQFGCTDTAYGDVIIKPDFSFYVPNAFTPNNDGVNDVFAGIGVNVKASTMYIYDRWGEIIFQSNDLEIPWDGRVSGSDKIAQEGVYVYLINIVDIFDTKHQYIGSVTLLK